MSPVTTPLHPALMVPMKKDHNNGVETSNTLSTFLRPPVFTDKVEEREYLKFRLAQAFRIFGKLGYDEGVAGHITVRVGYFVVYNLRYFHRQLLESRTLSRPDVFGSIPLDCISHLSNQEIYCLWTTLGPF